MQGTRLAALWSSHADIYMCTHTNLQTLTQTHAESKHVTTVQPYNCIVCTNESTYPHKTGAWVFIAAVFIKTQNQT